MGYIYIHTNKLNGKKYIGQTTMKPEQRWGADGGNYKKCTYFYGAIRKYGWNNFDHEVFELPDDQLDYAERYLIAFYDTLNHEKGYNLESGGNKNKKMSEESNQKRSLTLKGRPGTMKGRHHSEETREKISRIHKGRKHSEEHNKNVANALKGHPGGMKGKHHSRETKEKLSEAHYKYRHIVKTPEGVCEEVFNLFGYCKERGITAGALRTNGHTKGYTLIEKELLPES